MYSGVPALKFLISLEPDDVKPCLDLEKHQLVRIKSPAHNFEDMDQSD
jgi:hypothetical protein